MPRIAQGAASAFLFSLAAITFPRSDFQGKTNLIRSERVLFGFLNSISGGLRKIRWSRSSMGKRGGARVIYYNVLDDGQIWLLIAYTKSKFDNLPVAFLRALREEVERWTRN